MDKSRRDLMTLQDKNIEDDAGNKSFFDHLTDLRNTILWSLGALTIGMMIAVPLSPYIFEWLKKPLTQAMGDADKVLQGIDFVGVLSMALNTIFWTGFILSFPFILFFISRFVFPGLKTIEKKAVKNSLAFAALLFVAGVALGYFLLLQITIAWMIKITEIFGINLDMIKASTYVSFVLKFLLALGISFEYPVVIILLGKIGVITIHQLKMYRRHVFVALLIASAIITPTVDPVTQMLLTVPMYVLYEICIIIIWTMRKNKKQDSEEESDQKTEESSED